ncbi:HotDog domain-containing protein, partial [Phlyctochytrium arcticum]
LKRRWKDNDQYSHINNAVYYSLFDSAVNIYLLSHIHSSASTSKPVFYVASSRAAYHASASFPDLLRVGVAVGKLGRSSVTYHLGVFRQLAEKEDWQCCVTGEFVHVLVDDAGKSVEIPSEIRQKLELLVPKPTA